MKKICKVIILTILILFGFIFTSCDNSSIDRIVSAVDIDTTTIPEYVEVGKYDITSSDIKITYTDGIVEYIDINETMISSDDLAKLNTIGYHAITVNYDGFSTILNINVVEEGYVKPEVLINKVIESITIPSKVKSSFDLVTSKDGVSIKWSSNSRSIEIEDNVALVEQSLTMDVTVTLTATFKYKNITKTKEYIVTIEQAKELFVESVIDSISIPSKVTSDFNLETSKNGVSITWEVTPGYLKIKENGYVEVTRPTDADKTVTITAKFYYQDIVKTKTYTVIVEKEIKNDSTSAALVDDVINSISVLNKVNNNFTLETSKNGVSITWEVTPGYLKIKENGYVEVTRPTDADVLVILTAKFYYKDIVKTKTYSVIIQKEDKVDSDDGSSTILVENVINSISVPSKVTSNFTIETIKNGVTITWISSSNNIEIKNNQAIVTRSTTDVTVNLTATFKYEDVIISKTYTIVVEKKVSLPSSTYDGDYYDNVSLDLVGEALKQELRNLMLTTHTTYTTYNDCKYKLPEIDDDLSNPGNMILFYTGQSIADSFDLNNDWNREHVWCQSLGWFKTSGAGSDLHHIRPCNISVNSSRGNKKYGVGGGYYTPTDEYKGDVARIIFYLMVAYKEADSYTFTSIAQSKELLLEWNKLDPVSEGEMVRNDRVEAIQGNRNPFIDYAELADSIWG